MFNTCIDIWMEDFVSAFQDSSLERSFRKTKIVVAKSSHSKRIPTIAFGTTPEVCIFRRLRKTVKNNY